MRNSGRPIGLVGYRTSTPPSPTGECIAPGGIVPVVPVTTSKAAGGAAGGMVAYYSGLARDHRVRDGQARGPVDYYLDRDEPPGRWWGRGANELGVGGEVQAEQPEALLTG